MASIPKRVADRLCTAAKRFQAVLSAAKSRDVNESDTAIIVTDLLAEMFGYDKYTEVTSEFAIRGTSCDLAVKLEGKLQFLAEIKAIGLELKDAHLKQAVDYAANQGIEWVVLTNGQIWRIYRVIFGKPINQELVGEFDLLTLDCRSEEQLQLVYLIAKEAWSKDVLDDFHSQKQALSRFTIAAMALSDTVLAVLRRELRRMSPDVRIDLEQIRTVLNQDVLKREVLEGEKADEARRKVQRLLAKATRSKESEPAKTPDQDGEPKVHPALEPMLAPPASVILALGAATLSKEPPPS
jgi:predicted type IV restriction endonuclease